MRALPLLLLCACATTRTATTGASSATVAHVEAAEVRRTERTTGGAVDSVTVVEEYLPEHGGRLTVPAGGPVAESDKGVAPASPTGQLLRRTTTRTHVEPLVAEAAEERRSLAETHAATEEHRTVVADSRPAWSPPAWAWAWVPVALLAVWLVGRRVLR